MQKNKVLKGLLAVSAVAAMLSTFGVQAQTSGTSSTSGQSASGAADQGLVVKPNNKNEDERGASPVAGGQPKSSSGSSGASGQSASGTSSQGTTGTNQDERGAPPTGGASGSMGKDQGSGGMSGMSGSSGGAAAGASGGSMSKADQKVLMDLARANMAEVAAGKLAQSKSQNDQVKSFAQQMIDDHSKALTEVQQVAQQKGVTLPSEPDAKHKAMAAKLEKMSGDAFDKAYMAQAGVADHKKVHSMLMQDQKRVKDPDVKGLVTKMTPVVEQHLKAAQQMATPKSGTTAGK